MFTQEFIHLLLSEFMGTALMILFGVGVHCDEVLKKLNIMVQVTYLLSQHGHSVLLLHYSSSVELVLTQQWH